MLTACSKRPSAVTCRFPLLNNSRASAIRCRVRRNLALCSFALRSGKPADGLSPMFFWRLAKLKRPSFNLTFDVSVIGRSVPTRGAFALCLLQRDHWLSQTLSSLFLSYERLTKREGSSGYRLFRIANPDH